MSHRRFKLDIYNRGVTATTGTIAYTLGSSFFRDAPVLGGQIVRPADCTVESNPYRLTLVDVGSTFTAKLADSSGRLWLLGRLARVRSSLDSTASYATIGVGRITDVALDADVASYTLDISDERWIERQTSIFTVANTVSLVPYGNISAFQQLPATPTQKWRCVNKVGNLVCLVYTGSLPIPTAPGIAALIVNDLKTGTIVGNTSVTAGNFNTLRWRNTGTATDYEITAFGGGVGTVGTVAVYPTSPLGFWNDPLLGAQGARDTPQEQLYVWLVWTTGTPAISAYVTGYLYAPTHEPTEDLPQLIGGTSGLHPGRFTRQVYSGTHSPSTAQMPRFSTRAFDRWEAEPAYGRVWFRITAPLVMADFLNERIYGPYNVAPITDSSGKISPTAMWLPTSTQLNLAGLAAITSTNALTHPTWEHPSADVVNVVRYTREQYVNYFQWPGQSLVALPKPTTLATTRAADTVTQFGRRLQTFRMGSVAPDGVAFLPTTTPGQYTIGAQGITDKVANSLFQRFADGPVYSQVDTSSGVDATTNGALMPGAFVKVRLNTFPNPALNARGSSRLMQIIQRDVTPVGRSFRLLDVGSNLQALATPTVSLALSSQSSRHAIKITVASVPAGANYEVQLAPSSSTGAGTPPASSKGVWYTAAYNTTASLVTVAGQLPSKTKFFARARSSKRGRVGSGWSTATVSAVTASIAAPSGLAASSITAGTALLKWTNGSTLYGTEVLVDATSTATLTGANLVATLPAATTRYRLIGLNSNDGHKAGVRHRDAFGGRSAQNTVTFTTTTAFTVAPSMKGLVIVAGA